MNDIVDLNNFKIRKYLQKKIKYAEDEFELGIISALLEMYDAGWIDVNLGSDGGYMFEMTKYKKQNVK